jgi:hypothetical protein
MSAPRQILRFAQDDAETKNFSQEPRRAARNSQPHNTLLSFVIEPELY